MYEISKKDFYHTHFVIERKTGEIVGLVGHALEFSKKRKAGNYIIFTSVQCFTKLLMGGKEGKQWIFGFDDPEVQALGKDLWFPADAKFGKKKGKKCKADEKELEIEVKQKGGKTKKVKICYKVRS